eukprot:9490171-Pyramimonas_sp.AAC.1
MRSVGKTKPESVYFVVCPWAPSLLVLSRSPVLCLGVAGSRRGARRDGRRRGGGGGGGGGGGEKD